MGGEKPFRAAKRVPDRAVYPGNLKPEFCCRRTKPKPPKPLTPWPAHHGTLIGWLTNRPHASPSLLIAAGSSACFRTTLCALNPSATTNVALSVLCFSPWMPEYTLGMENFEKNGHQGRRLGVSCFQPGGKMEIPAYAGFQIGNPG
jgi:hypothetical protein